MIDTMLIFASVVSFAGGVFVGAVAMGAHKEGKRK